MSTRIHPKNVHENSPKKEDFSWTKVSTKCHQKCPLDVTSFVHEMSPIMSTRCLPPVFALTYHSSYRQNNNHGPVFTYSFQKTYAEICLRSVQLSWLIAFLGPLFWAKRWGWQPKLSLVIVWPRSTYLSWRQTQNVYGHISRILVMTRARGRLGFIKKMSATNPTVCIIQCMYKYIVHNT